MKIVLSIVSINIIGAIPVSNTSIGDGFFRQTSVEVQK